MRHLVLALCTYISFYAQAYAMGTKPATVPSTPPKPTIVPSPEPKLIKIVNYGVSVNRVFADQAASYLNAIYANGCLKRSILAHKFKSLNTVFEQSPRTNIEAAEGYMSEAPHTVDLRWYSKPEGNVIGYTYNFKADTTETEIRIFTNTKYLIDMPGYNNPRFYASHLAHELSHQAQAGGFVHYTIHQGSFPYDIGNLAATCIKQLVF